MTKTTTFDDLPAEVKLQVLRHVLWGGDEKAHKVGDHALITGLQQPSAVALNCTRARVVETLDAATGRVKVQTDISNAPNTNGFLRVKLQNLTFADDTLPSGLELTEDEFNPNPPCVVRGVAAAKAGAILACVSRGFRELVTTRTCGRITSSSPYSI
jgi:hypothetical protein